jgi:hypothetical protein
VFLKRSEVLYACLPFLGRKEKEESESPIMVWHCRSAAACVEVKRKKKGKAGGHGINRLVRFGFAVLFSRFFDKEKLPRKRFVYIYYTKDFFDPLK